MHISLKRFKTHVFQICCSEILVDFFFLKVFIQWFSDNAFNKADNNVLRNHTIFLILLCFYPTLFFLLRKAHHKIINIKQLL